MFIVTVIEREINQNQKIPGSTPGHGNLKKVNLSGAKQETMNLIGQ